jgi:hypothetical protein
VEEEVVGSEASKARAAAVAEEEAATAVDGKRRWRPSRAPRRPHCPGSALSAAGGRKKRRSPAARSGRRGKEEKEEPRCKIRPPGKLLTPKIATGKRLTYGPSLVKKHHSTGNFPQSIK